MKSIFYSLIFVALTLAACQTTPADPSPTATPPAAATLTPPAETSTPTKAVPTFTPTATQSPLDIASSMLTELSIDVDRDAYGPCLWERLLAFALTEGAQRKYNNQFFTYVRVACEQEWVLVQEWSEQGLGYSVPDILGWSADGKHLYFYDAIIPDGCQPIGGWQRDLRRVDLQTGAIDPIALDFTGGISLSNDTTKIIYYDWEKVEIGIYDLITAEEQRIPFRLPEQIEYWEVGNFTWSPDDQRVLFVAQYGDTCFPDYWAFHRLDLPDKKISTLVENDAHFLYIAEWAEENRATLIINEETWWLNPSTGRLVKP